MKIDILKIKPLKVTNASTGQEMEVVDYPSLLALDADVYIIFGMRSFGKSYGILQHCVDKWLANGEQFAVMRSIDDDVTQNKIRGYIGTIKNYFEDKTKKEKELNVYQGAIEARSVSGRHVFREKVGSFLSLSGWLKYKGNNYDDVTTIIFEEFLEPKQRLKPDDWLEGYLNNLSTIIRLRDNVKVFCLANTVKQKSPLFDYYHIDIKKIRKGKVTLFTEENGLRLCVYWTPDVKLDNTATKHYSVNQTKQAKMITSGQWEETEYPTEWNGYSLHGVMVSGLKRFSTMFRFYIKDLNLVVSIPGRDDTPFLIYRPRSQKSRQHSITTKELITLYPELSKAFKAAIITGRILTEPECFIDIDNFIDKTF